jgi:hypothetical protein
VATILGKTYRASQMTYDLTRLRGKGIIERVRHAHLRAYRARPARGDLLHQDLLPRHRPALRCRGPGASARASPEFRAALRTIDCAIANYVEEANLAA